MSENLSKGRFSTAKASKIVKTGGFVLLGLICMLMVGVLIWKAQSPKPENIRVTNITDKSFTVSWTTDDPSAGSVLYTDEKGIFAWAKAKSSKLMAYDDRDVSKAELEAAEEDWESALNGEYSVKSQKYYTHHVTVKELDAETPYKFKVGNGVFYYGPKNLIAANFSAANSDEVMTLPALDTMSMTPVPAYGNVRAQTPDSNENSRIVVNDGLFYAQVFANDTTYYASALINQEGRWYLDFSNLRDNEGEAVKPEDTVDTYQAYIEGGAFGASEITELSFENDAPADDIVISSGEIKIGANLGVYQGLVKPVYANRFCPEGVNEIEDSSKCGCVEGENKKVRCRTNDGSSDWCVDTGEACVETEPVPRLDVGGGSDGGSDGGESGANDSGLDPDDLEYLYDEEICIEDVDGACDYRISEWGWHSEGCGICCKTKWQHVYRRESDGAIVTSDAGRESEYHANDSECGRAEPKEESLKIRRKPGRTLTYSCCVKDNNFFVAQETRGNDGSPYCFGWIPPGTYEYGDYVGSGNHESCQEIQCKYTGSNGIVKCHSQRRGNCKGEEVASCHGLSANPSMQEYNSLFTYRAAAAEKVQIVGSDTVLEAQQDGVYTLTIPGDEKQYEVVLEKGKTYVFFKDTNENGVQDEGEEVINLQNDAVELYYNDEEQVKKIQLEAGLNFVSFNVIPKSIDSCKFLEEINVDKSDDQLITQISRFEGGKFEVTSYRKDTQQPVGGTCFPVVAGQGYIIKTFGESTISYGGYALTKPVELLFPTSGWHLVGVNGTKKQYTADSLILSINEVEGLTVNNISTWRSDASRYDGLQKDLNEDNTYKSYGFDFPVDPEKSYFLRVVSGSGRWLPEAGE
ncbi:hypothetical protein GF357_01200 [Candidatus Dojkabacteria bacterium]|nr:hypothetical protein [Candidatus Dojkabacteria bacterium]